MPLKHGHKARTIRANIGPNIATERRAGVPRRQVIAIAYSIARRDAKKAHIRMPKGIKQGPRDAADPSRAVRVKHGHHLDAD